MAFCIARLLNYASRKGGTAWDKCKNILRSVEKWINLFNAAYEDDVMTKDEERKIADAISNMTSSGDVKSVLEQQ